MTDLVWLVLSLALAAAPHLEHLPLWMGPLCLAIGIWRLIAERRRKWLPGTWPLLFLALAATAGVFLHYRTLFGRDSGAALLVVMTALKLMEMKSRRDVMVLVFLGYFLVATSFFYSQSIPAAFYLFLVVLVTTATMIGYSDLNHGMGMRARLRVAGTLLLQAVPLMLVLFVLFPRVGPLWGLPKDVYSGMTGLSDKMSPGAISQLINSDAIAFRVRFDGPPPAKSLRYWRGPVLWNYDGRTWFGRRGSAKEKPTVIHLGDSVSYTVTLEPDNQRWLFALDLPATFPPNSTVLGDYQIVAREPVQQRLRYSLLSFPHYRLGVQQSDEERQRALRLPRDADPGARALAARWHDTLHDPRAIVREALTMFREQPFVYTLNPPLLGRQAVDEFLFDTRRGFCEHYAGAFVFLMRAAGVPARVVTGYQGGEMNPLGDYMIVRQSDAHAWAEVWLEQDGWVRVDPTAAVSPSRIESGIAGALPVAELPPSLLQLDSAWLRRARLSWDLINNNWNQWVLGYGQERQMRFLSQLHPGLESWDNMALALAVSIAALVLTTAAWMLWRNPGRARDPALAAYDRFCAKLARRGVVRLPQEGPADFATRAASLRPELAPRIRRVTRLYIALRYGRHHAWLPHLRRAVRTFR